MKNLIAVFFNNVKSSSASFKIDAIDVYKAVRDSLLASLGVVSLLVLNTVITPVDVVNLNPKLLLITFAGAFIVSLARRFAVDN